MKYQIILITLLINAAKYTFQGYIKVNLWIEEQMESLREEAEKPKVYLITSVEDTGIGISQEAQNSLFQMFGKLQNEGNAKHRSPIHGNIYIYIYIIYRCGFWIEYFQATN